MLQIVWGLIALISVITIIILTAFFGSSVLFIRYKYRNDLIKALAKDFNLNYEEKLYPFKQITSAMWKDLNINHVFGKVGNHTIDIQDFCYDNPLKHWMQNSRETKILIDGQRFEGSIKNVSLGSKEHFSSVHELKNLLNGLRNN